MKKRLIAVAAAAAMAAITLVGLGSTAHAGTSWDDKGSSHGTSWE